MIDVEKLRKLKGRRIYQFWLDEETGDITDVTSLDDVIRVIYCEDCKNNGTSDCGMSRWYYADNEPFHKESWNNPYDYCSRGEKNENEI